MCGWGGGGEGSCVGGGGGEGSCVRGGWRGELCEGRGVERGAV